MTEKLPSSESTNRPASESTNRPASQPTEQSKVVRADRTTAAEKRPVAERAKETANAGYRIVRWIVLIVLVVIATVFIIRNFERVKVDWVFGTTTIPLAVVMISFLGIGIVIGWLIHWFSIRSQRR
jgi:uncharacterized integral membrane protein